MICDACSTWPGVGRGRHPPCHEGCAPQSPVRHAGSAPLAHRALASHAQCGAPDVPSSCIMAPLSHGFIVTCTSWAYLDRREARLHMLGHWGGEGLQRATYWEQGIESRAGMTWAEKLLWCQGAFDVGQQVSMIPRPAQLVRMSWRILPWISR